MPTGLGQATSGGNGSPGGGQPGDPTNPDTDIGNGSQEGGGTTVINPGGGPSTGYSYEVISLYGGIGSAYLALNNSNMTCNSSVGVFNRNNTFAAINTSTGNFSNCCSYAAHQGFIAYDSSKVATYLCTAVLSASNYRCIAASSMYCSLSASVFPILYGAYVSNTSSFVCNEYETMTSIFASNAPTPTHFRSGQNSFCTNNSNNLTTKNSAGLSGPVVDGRNISFIWSQIWRHPLTGIGFPINTAQTINPITTTSSASYRYVPMNHSVDYFQLPFDAQGAAGINIAAGAVDTQALTTIYAQGRNCYVSVKGSGFGGHLFPPEDGSGSTGNKALGGVYSVFDLLATLT